MCAPAGAGSGHVCRPHRDCSDSTSRTSALGCIKPTKEAKDSLHSSGFTDVDGFEIEMAGLSARSGWDGPQGPRTSRFCATSSRRSAVGAVSGGLGGQVTPLVTHLHSIGVVTLFGVLDSSQQAHPKAEQWSLRQRRYPRPPLLLLQQARLQLVRAWRSRRAPV